MLLGDSSIELKELVIISVINRIQSHIHCCGHCENECLDMLKCGSCGTSKYVEECERTKFYDYNYYCKRCASKSSGGMYGFL